jgi:hypothetical protein
VSEFQPSEAARRFVGILALVLATAIGMLAIGTISSVTAVAVVGAVMFGLSVFLLIAFRLHLTGDRRQDDPRLSILRVDREIRSALFTGAAIWNSIKLVTKRRQP